MSGLMNDALSYFSNQLSGFSTNTFKIMPQGKTSGIVAGDILTVNLPSNSICDLKSIQLHLKATVAGTTARLPNGIQSLIQRVEILAGGVQLAQGVQYYNTLVKVKEALCDKLCNPVAGHPDIIRNVNPLDGVAIGPSVTTVEPTFGVFLDPSDSPFVIDRWEGFLGSAAPRYLDLSLLPDVQIRLYMASNNVLTASATNGPPSGLVLGEGTDFTNSVTGITPATYSVSNVFATCELISLADVSYDNMLTEMMAQQSFLEVPFKAYYSFSQGHNGSSRFQVSSQSIDRIWSAWQYSGSFVPGPDATGRKYPYTAQASPIPVLGYAPNPVVETKWGSDSTTAKEKYTAAWECFQQPVKGMEMQYQLNGAMIPQTPLTSSQLLPFSGHNLPPGKYVNDELTMAQYLKSNFVQCLRLNMAGSEDGRILSGIDSRSANLQGLLNTTGATITDAYNSFIVVETTATMRILPGRAISIIS